MNPTIWPLLAGKVAQSTATTGTATATVAASTLRRHVALGIHAAYSAAPAAGFKTITLKRSTATLIQFDHDFSLGEFLVGLPVGLGGTTAYNQALSVELQSPGSTSVFGRAALFYVSTPTKGG